MAKAAQPGVVAAERSNAGSFIVQTHDPPTGFLELQGAIHDQLELGRSTGKSLPTVFAKPDGACAGSQPWIPTGEQSGLLTHIATTEAFLCARG